MVVAEGRYAVTRTEGSGVFEDVIRNGCRHTEDRWVGVTETVVRVDICESPSLVGQLLADTLTAELGLGIVNMPPVDLLLVLERAVTESIKLLHGSQLTCSGLHEVKDLARNIILGEVKRDECEVPTA